MPRIASLKTKQYRMIKILTELGYSSRNINKELKNVYGSGIRRKTLLAEIRSIKGKTVTKEKRQKGIPKKYRKEAPKKWREKALKIGQIYRGSLIISSIPLHSTPFNRHYLGFRLNIFSYNKDEVYNTLRIMKKDFIKMVAKKLKSLPYADEQILGIEKPTKINVTNPQSLNGKWFFAIEEKGSDIDSESGYI